MAQGRMIEAILVGREARGDAAEAIEGVSGTAMTDTTEAASDDLIGLSITGTLGNDPGLATERIIVFRDIDPIWRDELVAAISDVNLSRHDQPAMTDAQPVTRTWHTRLQIDCRSTRLVLAEPLADPALEALLRAVRNCFPARRAMAIDEVPPWLIALVAVAEPPPDGIALNYLMDD